MAHSFLNEYEILSSSTSHEGAFATVYKVRHKQLGYIRAIRVLREAIVDEHDETYQKFLTECQLLLRLGNGGHPNIVRIAQPRLLQGHALVEMEYINGKDLNDYIVEKNQFIPIDEVLRFVHEISSALAYCHEGIYEFCMDREQDDLRDDPKDGSKVLLDTPTKQRLIDKYKVIHNDIHSKNIIRKYDGSFILLDFGLSIQNGTVVKSSTRKGGAAEYKAPEKWGNEELISEQTDIYSFGILMYEMLAGQVPFPYIEKISAKAEYELMQQHENKKPLPIESLRSTAFERANPNKKYGKDYPDWLESMIMKCLEKKAIDRYKNGQVLFEEVKKYLAEANNQANNEAITKLQVENNQLDHKITQLQQHNKDLETQIETLKKAILQNKIDTDKKIKQLEKEKTEIEKVRAKLQKQTEDAEDQHKMGDKYYYEKNYIEAVKCYRKGALQGNSSDQTNLGWMYRNGYGVIKNYTEAAKWYKKAAEQGNASAQSWLGFMYENGYGVTKDKTKAIEWYKKAAKQGNQTAISNLKNLEIDNK